ncbi:twin-arginine translocase subunit TatC [Nakamurella sp.]|uniref:twin-arginine translocase subunit TatC n=1 Tax=Nakamurella sp. TaxID=1869182 RepID=UPI003B3B33E1
MSLHLTVRRRPNREPRPADGAMPLLDHLNEFRRRLFVATLGLLVGAGVGFVWFGHGIPAIGLPSLGDVLTGPYCAVPATERVTFGGSGFGGGDCRLLATGPFSALELQLKSALIAGSVLSAPVWLSQLWGFVTPALHTRERRYAITFATAGAALFLAGTVLAYLVIREGLTVLLGFGGDATIAALTPDSYFSFLIAMLIVFGVSFELPLLLIMLNRMSVVSHAQLGSWRRYAVFALVVFAGLIVPGNDPITMLALAVSLITLYELSVQVARIHDRRLARRRATHALPDDSPSILPVPDSNEVST